MPSIAAGASVTLTLTDSDSITAQTAGVLTVTAVSGLGIAAGKIAEITGHRVLGPYQAGSITLAVSGRDCYYEVADGGSYWNELGSVNIHRLRDRLFVGEGTKSSGNKFPSSAETWLTTILDNYFERGAQTLSVSTFGQSGIVGASRTSEQDAHNYGTAAIGVVGVVVNDRTSGAGIGWGGYFEANRQSSVPSGQGTVFGTEVAVKNRNNDVTNGPYNKLPGGSTIGDWFAGGGDASYNGAPANPSTCAILIGKNATTWNKGIVIEALGITGTDGVTGTGTAISMAKGHVIEWQVTGGFTGAAIRSDVTSSAQRTGFIFNNDQVWMTAGGSIVATAEKGTGTDSYLRLVSALAGSPAQVKVQSTDVNSDLLLTPQGTGTVRFGFFTTNVDAPVTGYVGIKDAAGTFRKLATIA